MALFDDRRSAWGAAAPRGGLAQVAPSTRRYFFVHWNGPKMSLKASDPHSKCLAQVRAFQRFHQSKGWADIGYDGLTCPHGRNIEGRGVQYRGAHCTGFNTTGHGWQAMVGEGNPIPSAVYSGIRRAYDELCKRDGRTLLKRGHRDGMSTACPGNVLYAWVKAGMPVKGGTTPAPSPTKPAPAPTTLTSTLRRGARGAQVTLLQKMLNKTRNSKLTVDGVFGPATENAVVSAHKAWGIATPHNVVGPGFRAKINAEYKKPTSPGTGTAPAPKPTTKPVLRNGSRGNDVKTLQGQLGGLVVDGSFGPATLAKVKAFQKARGLVVDGVVGAKTWAALGSIKNWATTRPKVRSGSRGDAVKELQRLIGGLVVDGSFGPATLNKVRVVQRNNRLAIDGVVGPKTWAALTG